MAKKNPKKPAGKNGFFSRLKEFFQPDEEFADLDAELTDENKKILHKFKDL